MAERIILAKTQWIWLIWGYQSAASSWTEQIHAFIYNQLKSQCHHVDKIFRQIVLTIGVLGVFSMSQQLMLSTESNVGQTKCKQTHQMILQQPWKLKIHTLCRTQSIYRNEFRCKKCGIFQAYRNYNNAEQMNTIQEKTHPIRIFKYM